MKLINSLLYMIISLFFITGDHGDNCSVKNINRQKLATTCKWKAVEDICQRPRKIILGEIQLLNLYKYTTYLVKIIILTVFQEKLMLLELPQQ